LLLLRRAEFSNRMHPLRLLHLEDNPIDAELVRHTFASERLDCDIVHATNRNSFEEALDKHHFDLIITDYAIPGWNGLEALACVRRRDKDVPFLFFSGALGEERAVEALKCGATDYVLKDRLARLVPVVRRALSEVEDHRKRVQAERALREAEERYRILFEQSPEAIIVLEPESMLVLDFNDEACRLFGYSAKEFSRLRLSDHVGIGQTQAFQANLSDALKTGRSEFETTYHNKRGDERSVWIAVRVIEIHGHPGFHTIWRDTTQRLETERRLLRSQRLESIGTLAGGIAHDLNNALAPILMSASLLREGASAESASLLDLIDTSAQRGAAMVRQLLTFAKGIDGQRILVQPRHLFREMEKIISATFPKNIRLEVRVSREEGVVLGDATQLHQVLLNLCVNARDAMPDGGTLSLETALNEVDDALAATVEGARPGRYVIMRVSDSGTGIKPEILDLIFDPFFTTKGPEKGTGMGLSTVLGIVRSHHGFIRVESRPGKGSTFSVYLPLAEGKKTDTERFHRHNEFQAKGELVLVVDDEAAVRNSVELLLQRLNFRTLTCASGHDALISFAQRRADISAIICDLQMPHMDGVVLVQALHRMSPQARVVVMSGNPSERQLAELKAMGVVAVLTKPFSAKQLVETLRNLFA
jgi:two-component system, cell cycle sensor histidine kinase and response regulator CckA